MNISLRLFITIAALTVAGSLFAGGGLVVDNAWIRYLPGDGPMAGYFTLRNEGEVTRTLVGASSPRFAKVHLHRTMQRDGMSSMEPVDAVPVPAHGEVAFEPGGYHLMLMQRQGDLSVGDEVSVALEFGDGSVRQVRFTVRPAWQE
ncbi:MAG: copper chaperone PCu(A)C [Lysobacterales bacterium]|jgi:copper(I)-binding protein